MFLLFAGEDYYPQGGMYDFRARAETVKELLVIVEKNYKKEHYYERWEWWHIYEADLLVRIIDQNSDDLLWK